MVQGLIVKRAGSGSPREAGWSRACVSRFSEMSAARRDRENLPWCTLLPVVLALCISGAGAQTPAPQQPDPLMSLMLSQPPLDTTSPVRPTAAFDPPVIRPGEQSTYRVTFNALEQFISWPTNLGAPSALHLRPGAHGQVLQMTGTNMMPLTSFNSRVRPTNEGEFVIPEFSVTVDGKPVAVPAARLEVAAEPPAGTPQFQELFLELRATNLHAGQPVVARVVYPGTPGSFPQLTQTQLTGEGFLVDQTSVRPRFEPTARNGITVMNSVSEITVTPIASGKLSIFAQGFAIANRGASGILSPPPGSVVFGGMVLGYTLLDSEPIEVEVTPLPKEGQLAGFTGAIGMFTMEDPRLSATTLRVGEPVKLTVRVRGGPGIARLVAPPPPPQSDDWQVLPSNDTPLPPQIAQAQGLTSFSYNLVALTDHTRATPRIPFCFFDPKKGGYVDLSIPSVSVTVTAGPTAADVQTLQQPDVIPGQEPEPVLSALAMAPGQSSLSLTPVQLQLWFPLFQLIPATGFFGIWYWDRRRRFLEQHPDIVRRRRALRALRRQRRALRRASRAGDGPKFAAAAVSALKVACAPHFPAEPQALVGADVLEVLAVDAPETGAGGPAQELVRRFFSLTDAARFSTASADQAGLLAAHEQLEALLERLERRLCV